MLVSSIFAEGSMNNKVVARFIDGQTIKGTTVDFNPGKPVFHVIDASAPAGSMAVTVQISRLKAVFFVKDLVGDPNRVKGTASTPPLPAMGRRVRVVFKDGEVLTGTTAGYQPGRPGFFMEPEDPNANEQRCYVVADAAAEIRLL
jgi:hypothetical protein